MLEVALVVRFHDVGPAVTVEVAGPRIDHEGSRVPTNVGQPKFDACQTVTWPTCGPETSRQRMSLRPSPSKSPMAWTCRSSVKVLPGDI